jgi:hypothetical protein
MLRGGLGIKVGTMFYFSTGFDFDTSSLFSCSAGLFGSFESSSEVSVSHSEFFILIIEGDVGLFGIHNIGHTAGISSTDRDVGTLHHSLMGGALRSVEDKGGEGLVKRARGVSGRQGIDILMVGQSKLSEAAEAGEENTM